jgi:phosphoribosylformylglycinamidine (FGAM) synthase PurS component
MHKEVDKEQVAQAILEKAVEVADVQRYKQMDIIEEASKELIHASDDKMRAHALTNTHAEAMSAEREAACWSL